MVCIAPGSTVAVSRCGFAVSRTVTAAVVRDRGVVDAGQGGPHRGAAAAIMMGL
jgi:hypothetical protein